MRSWDLRAFGPTIVIALTMAACSGGTSPPSTSAAAQPRVVAVVLSDFAFDPAVIDVEVGESIRIIAVNRSDLPHELFIGAAAEQDRHHALHASALPDQQAALEDGLTGIYVPPRGTGQLTYRFAEAGELTIGCHLVGHFEAGMVGVIRASVD